MIYFILFLFISTITFLVAVYFLQEKFIFLSGAKIARDYQYQFFHKFEEVFIKTSEKNEVNALHFKQPSPKGVILFCHGNAGNLTKWGLRISYLLEYNYEVLVFDYRNYGKSTGKFEEKELYEDGLAVYGYLKKRYREKNIVVYGFSLGSTFATRIAALNKPKELILEAPFLNFRKATQYYSKWVPTILLKYAFRTDQDISKVSAPIAIFHGSKDIITSCAQSRLLLAHSITTKNQFIEINGATHHDIKNFAIYGDKLKEILER